MKHRQAEGRITARAGVLMLCAGLVCLLVGIPDRSQQAKRSFRAVLPMVEAAPAGTPGECLKTLPLR